MASLDPGFHQETDYLHREHEELMAQLDELDAALEQIVCYTEVLTDLAMANQAMASGKWMAEWLPKHHAREETTVLEMIARMSPELASFAREMQSASTTKCGCGWRTSAITLRTSASNATWKPRWRN